MIKPKKQFGQNFLLDETLIRKLVDLINPPSDARVLEVGAGTGGMTRELASRAAHITAIEIDSELEPTLRKNLSSINNVELIIQDALALHFEDYKASCFVSNVPYYITRELLMKTFTTLPPFDLVAVMIQKEVADKLAGERSSPLSLFASGLYDIEVATTLEASLFTPPPTVDSAFVIMRKKFSPPFIGLDYKKLERLIMAAFAARRKTIGNNVKRIGIGADVLQAAGINPGARAEELDALAFKRLYCATIPNDI